MFAAHIAILVVAQAIAPPVAQEESPIARAALNAFAGKCVQCHGPDLPFPKAEFGYVTDLVRLAQSRKYVVPGDLDKSDLWKEIVEGDMPPDTARAGPLTAAETEAIRRWIQEGAPTLHDGAQPRPSEGAPIAGVPDPATPDPTPTQLPAPRAPLDRLIVLLGRTHVLVVHFPIALLLVAAVIEFMNIIRGSSVVWPASRLNLSLGATAAVVAAGLGWVHALDGFAGPWSSPLTNMGLHRWLGTAVGVLAPVVAILAERDSRSGQRSRGMQLAILFLALIVVAASHFGGLLTHGADFLTL